MIRNFDQFREIWFVDFEYQQTGSGLPLPVCLVAHELKSGRRIYAWQDELLRLKDAPYSLDNRSLFVSYFSSAEMWCHVALGWNLPTYILDLHVEFCHLTNGNRPKGMKPNLLSTLSHFGIESVTKEYKEQMRRLITENQSWSEDQRVEILKYCESDVIALPKLIEAMRARIDVPHALFRGKFLLSIAKMEAVGVPLDAETLGRINSNKQKILENIVRSFDPESELFEGLVFKQQRFANWLKEKSITWPRTDNGKLKLDKEFFKDMSLRYPEVEALKEIRKTLSQLRETSLTVDRFGRSRCFLAPFSSLTSRNQPSNSKFIFGFAKWFRHLIKPSAGKAIAYIDWSQQEFGIAAALSRDPAMIEAYQTGDAYLGFAKQAKAVPVNATKETHLEIRNRFKQCILAVQYGMGTEALAKKLGIKFIEAKELQRTHKRIYSKFWQWTESAVNHAMLTNQMKTQFDWTWNITKDTKPTTLRNFHMQANGAEMMRLACILAQQEGVSICAPVHDALLIEADIEKIDEAVAKTKGAMARASAYVLSGIKLQSDVKIVRYPDRFVESEAKELWEIVQASLREFDPSSRLNEAQGVVQNRTPAPSTYLSHGGDL